MRKLRLLASVALVAASPAMAQTHLAQIHQAQTQQQRAQSVEGEVGAAGVPAAGAPAATGARAEVLTTEEFLRLAAMSDRFEIASSRLVGGQTRNDKVKQFAEHMVRDHEKTTQERQKVAQQIPGAGAGAATPLPQGRETQGTAQSGPITNAQGGPQHQGLDQKHTALLQQLHDASGAERDRLYVTQQVSAHQQAVDMFRAYAQHGENAALKQWAGQTLPALEQHLRAAQDLQRSL